MNSTVPTDRDENLVVGGQDFGTSVGPGTADKGLPKVCKPSMLSRSKPGTYRFELRGS
jgi:hypothetical protein